MKLKIIDWVAQNPEKTGEALEHYGISTGEFTEWQHRVPMLRELSKQKVRSAQKAREKKLER